MEFSIQEGRREDTSKSDEVSFKLLMIENNELWKIPLLCFAGVGCDSVSEVSENYPGCGIQMVCRTGLTVSPSSSTLVCSDKPNVFSPQTSFREVIKVEKKVWKILENIFYAFLDKLEYSKHILQKKKVLKIPPFLKPPTPKVYKFSTLFFSTLMTSLRCTWSL